MSRKGAKSLLRACETTRSESEAGRREAPALEHLADGVADEGDGSSELKSILVFCSILVVCCWCVLWLRWEAFRCSSNSSFCGVGGSAGWGRGTKRQVA